MVTQQMAEAATTKFQVNRTKKRASPAQAMVEFAIALPVFFALLYGILEMGRLLFLYSTVVTASRQAVRYGSATGEGAGGSPRYQDCDGIRQAANNAGYLGPFDTITLQYDTGSGSTPTTYCAGSLDSSFWPSASLANPNRLIVTVSKQFTPIVPAFVPFASRTLTATSARTIILSVLIMETSVSMPAGNSGGIGLSITASPTTYDTVGQLISYSYQVANIGTSDLNTPISITGNIGSVSCAGQPATLPAGNSFNCTGAYQITQADLDHGSVTNNATAMVENSTAQDTETVTATVNPSLALTIVPDIEASATPGTIITYTYTLTNSGNVTLGTPYTISDNKINHSNLSCPSTPSSLLPGNSVACTGTYSLKNSDINAGTFVNTATGTAKRGGQTITSNSTSAIVYTPPVYLKVTTSANAVNQAGQVINYTYNLKNTTDKNLKPPYTVSDSRVTNGSCPASPDPLPPGASVICTGSYTATQADLDAGASLISTVTATAKRSNGNQTYTSNQATASVGVTQNPGLSLAFSANPTTATTLGTVVNYSYTLTNTGNVTLANPSIADDKVTNAVCSNTSSLAPGGVRVCSGSLTINQAHLDAGSINHRATASAKMGSLTVYSSVQSLTVITYVGARLKLEVTSNPPSATGAGQTLTFTYTLKNTGSVVLTAPYSVSSSVAGSGDCSAAATSIPVGGSTVCLGFYTTTSADVSHGSVTNNATATAKDGSTTITSNSASATVPVTP